ERFAQQRRIHLKRKAKLKAQPKTVTPGISTKPLPKAQPPKAPVFKSASISSPVVPAFTEPTKAKFDLAVRALRGKRSLSERLTIAAFHLRSDPTLSAIDPRELLIELQNK